MFESRNPDVRNVAVLGSTGSIGGQTLDIIRLFPDRFKVSVLSTGSAVDRLADQAREFLPECVVIADKARVASLQERLAELPIDVLDGESGLEEAAALESTDVVVTAVVGATGLRPTVAAIKAGKRIALANKETLVIAGSLICPLAAKHDSEIIPVDSEHSAIFQCLVGEEKESIERLILTASGGPFRERALETFSQITKEEALRHPTWQMGPKITIDSATMMNKGLEVLEAHWLFDVDADAIDVLVHPQSIVHSLVSFVDGSTKAQLGVPDMKVPIQYALCYPERWPADHPRISWHDVDDLQFRKPDPAKFPCLGLAFDALNAKGATPAVLNAANEMAVALFLQDKIGFLDIPSLIERTMNDLEDEGSATIEDLFHADRRARSRVQELANAQVH
ncbi:MAG: 1-deoxy-D-xylulose-5-phosphate reductoisomerase [Bacteroidetes bacterium]|nr:1-deoxy-D-xylulose-5-phosphate reductoisomerase [Bacteroidota bacterium]MCH8244804.1 1-deoxy-D-xylulose-5-phosphate reductoisomerase [Bacteroidota bacterium]